MRKPFALIGIIGYVGAHGGHLEHFTASVMETTFEKTAKAEHSLFASLSNGISHKAELPRLHHSVDVPGPLLEDEFRMQMEQKVLLGIDENAIHSFRNNVDPSELVVPHEFRSGTTFDPVAYEATLKRAETPETHNSNLRRLR